MPAVYAGHCVRRPGLGVGRLVRPWRGRTSGSPLGGRTSDPLRSLRPRAAPPRSPRSVRRARRAPCRRHRHPLSWPSRCWIPGSGGRGPTSTELRHVNVPFSHPSEVYPQKDGRKVRSRWEGTFMFRCAPRGRPHTRPTRRPCAETGPAEPGARRLGSARPEAGRSRAPSAPASPRSSPPPCAPALPRALGPRAARPVS